MKLQDLDIVYPLKADGRYEDFRHGLRSVCENMPHRNLVIVSTDIPEWLTGENIVQIVCADATVNKHTNGDAKIRSIVRDERVSDNFVLMNDDFYVLHPIKTTDDIPYYSWGLIHSHLIKLMDRFSNVSDYMRMLLRAEALLREQGLTDYDYDIHCPMVMNKELLSAVLDQGIHTHRIAKRTLYGNTAKVKPVVVEDFKYNDIYADVNWERPFASTSDSPSSKARLQLYEKYDTPCKYENPSPWYN